MQLLKLLLTLTCASMSVLVCIYMELLKILNDLLHCVQITQVCYKMRGLDSMQPQIIEAKI